MKFKKTRIALSIFFAILCVALTCMWKRSSSTCDIVFKLDVTNRATTLGSNSGTIYFAHSFVPSYGRINAPRQSHGWKTANSLATWDPQQFAWNSTPRNDIIKFPYWLPVLSCSALAFLVWMPSRFSVRTLLLAIALVSVHLGAAIWCWRNM